MLSWRYVATLVWQMFVSSHTLLMIMILVDGDPVGLIEHPVLAAYLCVTWIILSLTWTFKLWEYLDNGRR